MRFIYYFSWENEILKKVDVKIVVNEKTSKIEIYKDKEVDVISLFVNIVNQFSKSQVNYISMNRDDLILFMQKCVIYDIKLDNENFKDLIKFKRFPHFFINNVFNNWSDISNNLQYYIDLLKIDDKLDFVDAIEEIFFRIKKVF